MAGRVKRAPPVPWLVGSGLACMRNEQVIVRDVNFTLHKGNAMVLTGPNASGKSTFLRVVSKAFSLILIPVCLFDILCTISHPSHCYFAVLFQCTLPPLLCSTRSIGGILWLNPIFSTNYLVT